MLKQKICLFGLMIFGLFVISQAQQSININTTTNNQYGQVTLPNTSPFNSLGGFQIIWRVREVGGTDGRNYATLFQQTGGFESIPSVGTPSRLDSSFAIRSGDTHDGAIYMTPTEFTDIVCKLQYDPANSRWTYETWKSDGTGYVSGTKTIQNTSNFNLGGETLTIGGSYWGILGQRLAKAKLNYWRWIQRVEPLGVFPTESAPTGVTYLAKYEFEGNVNDTSGNGLNLTWYGDTPTYEGGSAPIKFYPSTLRITKGKTNTATAVSTDASGMIIPNIQYNFASANSAIATATPNIEDFGGVTSKNLASIKAIASGTTTVTASYNGTTSNAITVTVDDPASAPSAIIHGDNDSFGGTSITTKVGEPIEVNAESSVGVNSIEWNWGDNDKTSDILSSTHSYLQAGNYTLTLTIKNSAGTTSTSSINVTVQNFTTPTTTYTVTTAQQLIDAYNLCTGGEHIVIPAGTTILGHIELPAKTFSDYVTIRSSGTMPDIRDRISSNSTQLATIKGQYTNVPTLRIKNNAAKLRFIGIKFDVFEQTTYDQFSIIEVGDYYQTSYSTNPQKIIFQHIVMNPPDTTMVRHGIFNDGYKVAVISSWLGNIFTRCIPGEGCITDSQAIISLSGKGAHVYNNNFLEASSENILYGGDNTLVDGGVPTNFEARRCYFFKRVAWKPNPTPLYNVKNLIEFKYGRRVYIEGNVFENHWLGADVGQSHAININSLPESYCPWVISEDIVFENNKVIEIPGGMLLAKSNGTGVSDYTPRSSQNIRFKNMLFDKFHAAGYKEFFIANGAEEIYIDHVTQIDTSLSADRAMQFAVPNNYRLNVTNSIIGLGTDYQIFSSYGMGRCALNFGTGGANMNSPCNQDGSWNMAKNVFVKYNTNAFLNPPANNFETLDFTTVGFTDLANGNYTLAATSPYKNQATDGTDVGINVSVLNQRTACAVSGLGTSCTTVSQSPYPGPNAPNIPITIEAENYDNGGETVSYHDIDTGNNGGVYRSNDVDIQARATASNGYEIFNASAGEWLEYTVNVPTAGYYNIGVRYASAFNNGTFHVEVDGTNVTGTMTATSTGSWSTFQTLTKPLVNLTAGNHVIRLALDTNSPDGCACVVADFDSISFTASTAPTAPTGLIGSVMSTTSVKLDWTDASNNETNFLVQRCSGATCTTFATVTGGTLAANTITFTNTGLTNGTTYRYRIGATNAVGTNYSNIITITVGIPTAPSSMTATAVAGKLANLAWSSSANNVTNFQVQRCQGTTTTCTATAGTWVNVSLTIPRTQLTYQDSGLTAGATYRYRVRAVNGAGNSAYTLTTSTITALP